MNNPNNKKSFSEYFRSSVIVSFLLWLAGLIYNGFSGGFWGGIAASYEKETAAARKSGIFSLIKKLKYGERVAIPTKRIIAAEFEQSFILGAVSDLLDAVLYCSQRVHGVFLLSFGIYTEIVFFVKAALSGSGLSSIDLTPCLIGAVLVLMSLPLVFSSQTLAQSLRESRFASFVIFTIIGASRESFSKDTVRREHMYIPFISGMVLGLLSAVISPIYIIFGLVALVGAYAVMCIPEFGLLAIIVLAPFAVLTPFAPSILLAGMTLFVTFSFLLKVMRGKRSIKFGITDLVITVFTVMTLIGGLISPNVSGSLKPALIYTVFLFGYFLCANLVRTKEMLYKCLFGLMASLFGVSAFGVAQYVFGLGATKWHDTTLFSDIEGRVVSTFENPNVLAEYLIMLIPLAFALMLTSDRHSSRSASFVTLCTSVLCLVFTWSRGAWLGFLFSAVIMLIMYSKKVLAFILSGIALLPFLPFVLPDSIINRFTSIGNLADTSTSYRVNIWTGVMRMLKDYWFSGIGTGYPAFAEVYPAYSLSGIETAPHAHNLFLQIITEHGIVVLVLFLIIIFFFAQSVFTFNKYEPTGKKYIPVAMMCGILAVLVQGLTDYVWYNYRVYLMFWIIIGLTTAARRCLRQPEQQYGI